ncbi:MAG: CapA family protein [Treponema sp.]|nr:CapA family protein [Treponema sp.]
MIKKILFILITISFFISCRNIPYKETGEYQESKIEAKTDEKPETQTDKKHDDISIVKPEVRTLTLIAAGDNLFHDTIFKTNNKNGIYDFSGIYSEIEELIQSADLAFINQETVMAGAQYGYSGYPAFNTPQALARTLFDTGFSIINQANNHSLDMGENGLLTTLDLWDTIEGITVLGARRSGDSYRIITKNNIRLGFLSYTYGLNGNTLSAKNRNIISLINRKSMEEEIGVLRPICDFLIVSMHWGEEYKGNPGKEQIELAQLLASLNVDLIIGHHPHVLQRFDTLPRPDGKQTLCFYSLGNFVSNQSEKERILGALMQVTFIKEGSTLSINEPQLIPVICHFEEGFTGTKVYPYYAYNDELLKKHWIRRRDNNCTFDFFNSVLNTLGVKLVLKKPL